MTICCKGELVDLSTPRVMGILNVTPDSFYDGGRYNAREIAVEQVRRMLGAGADFIDVGGYSSRPGASDIPEAEEHQRVVPLIADLVKEFPEIRISIDTFRSGVAEAALKAGAALVNDISGGQLDPKMLPLVAEARVPYVLMHMRGTPQDMTSRTAYDNLLVDLLKYFSERLAAARDLGIADCIADPGFGFAKTREQNFELLAGLAAFRELEAPLLVGLSRKSMIWKTLNIRPQEALNGTTALHMLALERGANILRVHDVREAVECIRLWEAFPGTDPAGFC
ncbi:dihydropteroate synthase [Robiginitalea sp. M366]|uniref:dihydropteroate synthase n=1 Tax=Robiginitalea aestuariiviva TaxID=3036903 RepID=UPI00240D2EC7|nr:dihydropteroate synthase [Robiginitalea aestuariiviva]MDG1572237.1 dihydropteroate synthase [Robiginitalea aestuariiviva]